MTTWLAHMAPALLIIAAVLVGWFGCWLTDRRKPTSTVVVIHHGHDATLATLPPDPRGAGTPVGDLAAARTGVRR